MTASTSVRSVVSSSVLRLVFPSTFRKADFTERISLSYQPPHHGAAGTMNFHLIRLVARNEDNGEVPIILRASLMSLEALLNASALSEYKVHGTPQRARNRRKARRKASEESPVVNSRCTALVVEHVNSKT